jgi:small subunit ribosomal protein S9
MKTMKEKKYYQAIGRRKTTTAIVKLFPEKSGEILVNKKNFKEYFPATYQQKIVLAPLELTQNLENFKIEVLTRGGGKNSQAEATRLGISRALVSFDPNLRPILKSAGFLKRDPRKKERKKFGLKKARKTPQWQKR